MDHLNTSNKLCSLIAFHTLKLSDNISFTTFKIRKHVLRTTKPSSSIAKSNQNQKHESIRTNKDPQTCANQKTREKHESESPDPKKHSQTCPNHIHANNTTKLNEFESKISPGAAPISREPNPNRTI